MLSGFSAEQVAALSPDIISSYSSEISEHLSPGVAQSFSNLDGGNNGSMSESSDESDGWGGTSTSTELYNETEETTIPESEDVFSSAGGCASLSRSAGRAGVSSTNV